ncbi:death-on-curing family protein [Geobacter metallireducens RCH3]|nr:death-on-curing family protein [Geobacter metallireducens RCH3]
MNRADKAIVLYQTPDGSSSLQVHLDHDTVWLTQKQMAELFGKDVRTVNEHIRNIFREGELDDASVIRKFRITASDGKSYDTAHYNLDVIISVGYRVKSQQGTRFRQWATRVLHDHIVKGYTLNEQRLREESAKLQAMQQTVALLARTLTNQELVSDTGRDVLRVIDDYAYALATLDRYDHGTLAIEGITRQAQQRIV